MTLPTTLVDWRPCRRIIPSRFPPAQLFERVTDTDDLEAVFMELDMRVYAVDLNGDLHDLRGLQDAHPLAYDKDNYAAAQNLAKALRQEGSNGVVYDSVRHAGGECAAVFRPPLLSNIRQERHLCYVWNGTRIAEIYEKREFDGKEKPPPT